MRGPLLSFLGDRELPAHTWAYGLWDEPASLRDWQADACALEWPFLVESTAVGRQFVFTDGSCLSPRSPVLSISGGSVILAKNTGKYEVVWSGLVPGLEQSSYRAELLAVTVALASFSCVTVFCDNFQVVTYAAKLLKMPARFRCDHLPEEHKDLWRYFCSCTQLRAWGDCIVRWVKAHQDVASLDGQDRILAIFNGYADAEAKKVVVERARCALYRELFASCHANKEAAVRLADMHVAIAQAFVEVDRPRRVCLDPAGFQVVGRGVALSELEAGPQVHEAFSKVLVQWLGALRWFPTCAAGWSGITAIELLWQFVFDTGMLPPFWYEGRWCTVDESVLCSFVLPGMPRLFRAWSRALGAIGGLSFLEVGEAGGGLREALGFSGLAVVGRIPLHPSVVEDLSSLFRRSFVVSSLRFPSFW